MNWSFIEGYEGKKIVDPESVDISQLETDKNVIMAYAELSKASHWRKDPVKGNLARSKSMTLTDSVRERLERVGWHCHIFQNGSTGCDCNQDDYLHSSFGFPQVHQVPFSSEWNIELTENELFNEDGTLRTKDETMQLLRERIGDESLDLDEMLSDSDLDEDIISTVKAIMESEDLTEIHEIDEESKTIRSGAKEFTWMDNEDEAEKRVREHLEDGELWRMAVEGEQTTLGLDAWIDHVINMDGWEPDLCTYDGTSHYLEDGKVYWRSN